jgi:hypothetical protein
LFVTTHMIQNMFVKDALKIIGRAVTNIRIILTTRCIKVKGRFVIPAIVNISPSFLFQ